MLHRGAHDGLHHRALQVHVPPPLPQHLAVHGDGGWDGGRTRVLFVRASFAPGRLFVDHGVYPWNAIEVVQPVQPVQLVQLVRSFVYSLDSTLT